jgi:2-aminoadipate transaminase
VQTIAFTRGVPAPECLPVAELADCARAAVERDGAAVLNYGPVAGYGPLREWVAERHGVTPDQVFVTNGSLQGLSLIAALLVDSGSRVLVEGPTYDRALHIIARHDGEPVPLPMDEEGLDPDALQLPAAFLYTIPTFQNPSGRTLSLERRRRLAELAAEGKLLVVEDDPYALVRYEGEPLPSICELAGGEGVVYSFSFSKIAAPGLRVGYLVAPSELIARLEALAVQTYLTPALLAQATAFEFVSRGLLEPNVERVVGLLRERRDAMRDALAAELAEGASWSRPEGGYFTWLDFPAGTEAADVLARGEDYGVTFVAGRDFFPPRRGGEGSARLAFSYVSPAEISTGVARLGALLRELRSSPVAV